MFDNMGAHCLSMFEVVSGNRTVHGACNETDSDGDQVFVLWEGKGDQAGTLSLAGGTGKYTQISGTGEYTFQPVKSSDDRSMLVTHHTVRWTLP